MSNKYFICKKIDEPRRFVGLTLDEIVPIVTISVLGFILGSMITGFVSAGIVWGLIRHFKKGQGTGWLLSLLYWHLPLPLFSKTPASAARHWLS